ncbi:ABC transporter permease [Caldisalinibacter kiritimatiensis]|uniref:Unspecified monosaccharide ABC transport system, permease component Ia / Ib n=1 Tax=Caldisalinibacter kiritimatiensis TaxID=1304284 RepID=R1CBC4_9FIRM|nr:ABC transporter permease [Caldisalinibacter kiritimatiensis]EOC99614.1 Unspecified monosaccharide ABC transport system, permease component Ia / Ib [Caldisalinibacter kiritimatiensis]
MASNKSSLKEKLISSSLSFTLFSVLVGLITGAIALLIAGYNPLEAYGVILRGIFSKPKYIAWTIIYATPLIMTGLSVTFAFRTGLFNIGAEGQFIIGALVATLIGYFLNLPPVIHVIVVFLTAAIASGIWGGIAGYLKAKFGIHEVIATIMLNWIALYLNTYIVMLPGFKRPESESSYKILDSASTMILKGWKESEAGIQWLSNHPILKDIFKAPVNWGFLIAILLAALVWYILNKTTLGYELRSVGFNKYAAEYGGINVDKSMVTSMVIAGALAGIAGAVQVTGYTECVSKLAAMEGYGFDGIAVSLIGGNTAFGNIFAGLLFGALKYAGPNIQFALNAPAEMVDIVIGTIVFFIAIPKFVKMVFTTFAKERGEKNVK